MKSFYFIFSFYILILSCIPCGDIRDCNEHNETNAQIIATNHASHEHEDESCSPFCICSCCGSTALNLLHSNEIKIGEDNESKYFLYTATNTSEIYLAIWQPPKVA